MKIQVRSATTDEWTTEDPVLLPGEFGYDKTSGSLRLGDGSAKWSELSEAGAGGVSIVDADQPSKFGELSIRKKDVTGDWYVTPDMSLATLNDGVLQRELMLSSTSPIANGFRTFTNLKSGADLRIFFISDAGFAIMNPDGEFSTISGIDNSVFNPGNVSTWAGVDRETGLVLVSFSGAYIESTDSYESRVCVSANGVDWNISTVDLGGLTAISAGPNGQLIASGVFDVGNSKYYVTDNNGLSWTEKTAVLNVNDRPAVYVDESASPIIKYTKFTDESGNATYWYVGIWLSSGVNPSTSQYEYYVTICTSQDAETWTKLTEYTDIGWTWENATVNDRSGLLFGLFNSAELLFMKYDGSTFSFDTLREETNLLSVGPDATVFLQEGEELLTYDLNSDSVLLRDPMMSPYVGNATLSTYWLSQGGSTETGQLMPRPTTEGSVLRYGDGIITWTVSPQLMAPKSGGLSGLVRLNSTTLGIASIHNPEVNHIDYELPEEFWIPAAGFYHDGHQYAVLFADDDTQLRAIVYRCDLGSVTKMGDVEVPEDLGFPMVLWCPEIATLVIQCEDSDHTIKASTDLGVTWTNSDATENTSALAWSGSRMLAYGLEMQYSDDGLNWTPVSSAPVVDGVGYIDGVGFVAVDGDGGKLYTSANASTWTQSGTWSYGWPHRVVSGADGIVAITDDGLYTSSDGTTWTLLREVDDYVEATYLDGKWLFWYTNIGKLEIGDSLTDATPVVINDDLMRLFGQIAYLGPIKNIVTVDYRRVDVPEGGDDGNALVKSGSGYEWGVPDPIVTSPNGTQYRIVVANDGALSTVAV